MDNTLDWLEKTQGAPVLNTPAKLTWERGPINEITGSAHTYAISGFDLANNPEAPEGAGTELNLYFQNGVIPEVGLNGVTPQVLLEILIDRFEGFQQGPFACAENDTALDSMRQALAAIQARTAERVSRGVEGTFEK